MSKRGANIYKRQDGRWEGRYEKGRDARGHILYGSCYGKTYREVRDKLAQAVAANTQAAPGEPCLAEFAEGWLTVQQNSVARSTFVKQESILRRHILPYFGGSPLRAIDSAMIERFQQALRARGLAPGTVKNILVALHEVLVYAAQQTPDAAVAAIRYPRIPRAERRVLTLQEQQRLVAYLTSAPDRYKLGVLLALCTGMRVGELCALQWANVHLAERFLRVTATLQRLPNADGARPGKTRVVMGPPKSAASERTIPLTEFSVGLLRRLGPQEPDVYVLSGTAKFVEPHTLQYHLRRYTRACGLTGVHFHTLRHTFATRCIEVGFELKSLSEILGHASTGITMECYVHSSLALKRDNMAKLTAVGF